MEWNGITIDVTKSNSLNEQSLLFWQPVIVPIYTRLHVFSVFFVLCIVLTNKIAAVDVGADALLTLTKLPRSCIHANISLGENMIF